MTSGKAQSVIMTCAVVVGGTYCYERFRGQQTASLESFATAFGVVFIVISLFAEASPPLAAGMAMLITTSDLLANIPTIMSETKSAEGGASSVSAGVSDVQATTIASTGDVNQIAQTAVSGVDSTLTSGAGEIAGVGTGALTGIRGLG